MGLTLLHKVARLLAICALFLQAVLPGTLSYAESRGLDVSDLICTTPGELTPQSRAAVQRLADLLQEEAPEHESSKDHCPLCTIAHAAPLPAPVILATPLIVPLDDDFVRFESGLVHKAQGPPIGSRGPPATI